MHFNLNNQRCTTLQKRQRALSERYTVNFNGHGYECGPCTLILDVKLTMCILRMAKQPFEQQIRNVRLPIKTIVWILFHKASAIVNQHGISIALRLAGSRKLSLVNRGTYLDGLPNSNTLCSSKCSFFIDLFYKTTSVTAEFSVLCNVSFFIP